MPISNLKKQLNELLSPWVNTSHDAWISGLTNDSRQIAPQDLFFAYPGFHVDGRKFIEQAVEKGVAAIVCEAGDALPEVKVPLIPMSDVFQKLGPIAARFYDNPSQKLNIIGITGTNGKSTIAYQLAEAYNLLGESSAYLGTLGQGKIGQFETLKNTTPDGLLLQKIFATDLEKGITRLCMEVSSHALAEGRVDGTTFKQAIFTNLTRDHLDFHGSMHTYGEAKARLFTFKGLRVGIVNGDDAASKQMISGLRQSGARLVQYGFGKTLDFRVVSHEIGLDQTQLTIDTPWGKGELKIRSLGLFNVYNTLAVLSSLLLESYPFEQVLEVVSKLNPVPGRMEIVSTHPTVIVDYAHTPDALENVLKTLKPLLKGKLWVVFGCGGNRDTGKRPIMGKIAAQYADQVMLTSDNPREEDPEAIIQEILTGIPKDVSVQINVDRKAAISAVLNQAGEADVVVVAGKGHETYQEIGRQRFDFSDQAIIRSIIR